MDFVENIGELNLSGQHLSRSTIHELSEYKNLRTLDLSSTNIASRDLFFLNDLRYLENLLLDSTSVDVELSSFLNRHESLRVLVISRTDVDERIYRTIASMPNLKQLDLSGNSLTTIEGLGNASQLEKLNLSQNQIGNSSVLEFPKFTNLKSLDLVDCKMSEAALKYLRSVCTFDIVS